jgi:hypothetical protein
MPLLKGSDRSIISQNISELRKTGKYSEAQAVAIAMKHSRKGTGKKLASIAKKVTHANPLKVK